MNRIGFALQGKMTPIINRRKKGISTVLTTLIIVVASVVLGTAVTLFGTSLFQTGAQQQSMAVTNTHLWYGATGTPHIEGVLVVRNSGDKIIALSDISIRGQSAPFANWYSGALSSANSTYAQAQYVFAANSTGMSGGNTRWSIDWDGTGSIINGAQPLNEGTGPISINPGQTYVVYFWMPSGSTSLTSADIGSAATLTAKAGQITIPQTVSVAQSS